jgi:hypothetical protein
MKADQTVIRSWLWNLIASASLGLMSVAVAATATSTTDMATIVIAATVSAFLACGAFRYILRRVVIDKAGLTVFGVIRRRRVARSAIVSVSCATLEEGQLLSAFVPIARLTDGGEVELKPLASYSRDAVLHYRKIICKTLGIATEFAAEAIS